MDKFLQTLMNTAMRRMVNLVVDKGFGYFATKDKVVTDQTGADRAQAKSAKDLANRARDIAKLARKIR
jgi:hypothetical protein